MVLKTPTVVPCPDFDPESDAKVLREACKGLGTDEDAIIDILTKRTNEQRQQITAQFKTMYGKDLIQELKSELNGNFEDVILAMMTEPIEYQAKQLHEAISGLGTDEATLVEILAIHDNEEIVRISQQYEGLYQSALEDDLVGESSGTFRRLLVSLSTGNRDDSDEVNPSQAAADAEELMKAGEEIFGTDESTFNAILCQRSRPQLLATFREYEKLSGNPFEEAIDSEFSGTSKEALIALVKALKNRPAYLAQRLHDSMSGLGTDEKALVRLIVSRSEIDLGEIKQVFEGKYEQSLADFIDGDCGGDYKKCLLGLVA